MDTDTEKEKKPPNWPRRLLLIRRHWRWTQGQLADTLGVDQGSISRWERGLTSPQSKVVKRAIRALRPTTKKEEEVGDGVAG